jgi:hypothetical protein
VLLADLGERLRTVESLDLKNEKLKRYRDYLWFDWVTLRAENAYLGADVRALEATLSETAPQGTEAP